MRYLAAKHARDNHAGDLRSDNIVCDPETDKFWVIFGGQEIEEIVVDLIYVVAMLPAIIEPSAGDLREATCSLESSQHQGIGWRAVDLPIGAGRMVGTIGRPRGSIVEEGFVVAVPWIGLHGESVGGIRGAFMMAVNDLDVCENIGFVLHLWIFSAPDMRHVAPIISP